MASETYPMNLEAFGQTENIKGDQRGWKKGNWQRFLFSFSDLLFLYFFLFFKKCCCAMNPHPPFCGRKVGYHLL